MLTAIAYVDLNPVRAAMAATPELSTYTSIKLHIEHWKKKAKMQSGEDEDTEFQPKSLLPFAGNPRQPMPPGIAFNLLDYIKLLDWTGRAIRDDK